MNLRVSLRIIGSLLLLIGLFMLTGISFLLYYGGDDIPALLKLELGTILVGLLLSVTNKNDRGEELTQRNVNLILSAGWIFVSLFGFLSFILEKVTYKVFLTNFIKLMNQKLFCLLNEF